MKKKGTFQYDCMDSFDKFVEEEMPTQEAFYGSILNNEHVSDEAYNMRETSGTPSTSKPWVITTNST